MEWNGRVRGLDGLLMHRNLGKLPVAARTNPAID